ncbi:MAG: PAS domain S-box protein [Pseudanabaena sp. ELA607]
MLSVCRELLAASVQYVAELQSQSKSEIKSDGANDRSEVSNSEHTLQALHQTLSSLDKALITIEECQQELIKDGQLYRDLFEFAPDGYFVTDALGKIRAANRPATIMLGTDLIGQTLDEFVYPSYLEQFRRLLGQLQRGQNIKSLDFCMRFPTGQPFDANFTILSIRDNLGKVVALRWWIQDITQRKQETTQQQQSKQQAEMRLAEMNAKINLAERQLRLEREEHRRAIRILNRSESKLRTLMQHGSEIVNIIEIDTTVQYCNPLSIRILGYPAEEIIGRKLIQFIHPDDLLHFQNAINKVMETPSSIMPLVLRYHHVNGDWIYMEASVSNLLQDGNIQGIVIHARDISERRRAESALNASELRLATIASNMPGTIYRLVRQTDGAIIVPFVSGGIKELTGLSATQVMAHPLGILDLVHPEDLEPLRALVWAGIEHLATFRHEFRIITPMGLVKWVQNIARYYEDDYGNLTVDGVCIDISERGEAEAELQRTHDLLQAVIHSAPVAIDILSPEGKVLLWNRAAEGMFGWKAEEVLGQTLPVAKDQVMEIQLLILNALSGNSVSSVLTNHQCQDGRFITVSLSTAVVRDSEGKIFGVLRIMESGNKVKEHDDYFKAEIMPADNYPYYNTNQNGNNHLITWDNSQPNNIGLDTSEPLLVFSNAYNHGQRHFAGMRLSGASLANLPLEQSCFDGASLNGVNFEKANLQNATFRGADLRGVNFRHADLTHADLRGADLRGANFDGATLLDTLFDEGHIPKSLPSLS